MDAVWNISSQVDEDVPHTRHRNSTRGQPTSRRGTRRPGFPFPERFMNHASQGSMQQPISNAKSKQSARGQPKRSMHSSRNYSESPHDRQLSSNTNYVQQAVDYSFSQSKPNDSSRNVRKSGDDDLEHSERSLPTERRERKIICGYKKMKDLVDKESNEILFTLTMPNNGFLEMLEKLEDKRDLTAYTLIALGKACSSSHRTNTCSLLSSVTQKKMFMFVAVQRYLTSFINSKNEDYHLESLFKLLEFLDCYQKFFTASSSEVLPILLPLIKITCQSVFKNDLQKLENIERHVKQMEEQQNEFISSHSKQEIKRTTKVELLTHQQPPENYRSIPILPSENDIFEQIPFLRPNVVEGKYSDTEHYLDVQFRLLREDYVRPLREGIAAYKRLKKSGHPAARNKDVKIYQNVHVIKQDFLNGNLIHIAAFNVKEFSRVNWMHSKRFLSGSLLCLSCDDFNTMFFASVAFRDVAKLEQGFLILKFEELSTATLHINPLQNFVMVETSAYFEAYRHNLSALHAMKADTFPLKNYIVDVDKNVQNPAYLKWNSTYDMVPILKSNSANDIVHLPFGFESVNVIEKRAKSITVLNDSDWLTSSDLGLDESQYQSLKTAITKEFAIIQGPPGTGKTYVGLKIVQLLLHNSSNWNTDNVSPILVVCYTNHALDQFLEGIRSFTDDIVRVGGRCSNEVLAQYQLRNLKKIVREKRSVPNHIFSNTRHQHFLLEQLKKDFGHLRKDVERSLDNLLEDYLLKPYIEEVQYKSLKSPTFSVIDDGHIVLDWLCLRYREFDEESAVTNYNYDHKEVFSSRLHGGLSSEENKTIVQPLNQLQNVLLNQGMDARILGEEDVEEEEFDTEFVEAMRDVDAEDFTGLMISDDIVYASNSNISSQGEFQIQGGEKKRKQYIKNMLANAVPLTEPIVKKIKDVWKLTIEARWQLYKYWLEKFIEAKQHDTLDLQVQMQNECAKLVELRTEEDLFLLREARVVGMTTTGAAKYRNIVLNIKPKVVVVEEAAEVLEAHIVTSLVEETQHLILIGDHQQLRPSPNVYDLAVRFNLNISLFERMVKNGMPYCQLILQHRMRPSIAELLVPHIYPNLKNHESVLEYEDIKGVVKNVFFVSHKFLENSEFDSNSRVNEHEAKFIIQLCKYLLLQGYSASQITILTTYTGQLSAIKKLAKSDIVKGVRITVVDNYQGEENDIILVSLVRSNDEGSIGFLKVSNRVCVALSRARKGLFCIGNFDLLAENSEVWKNILETLKNQDAIGPALSLQCQNHKDVITLVAKDKDFSEVAEGGCSQLCNYRLECGHTCPKVCHSYDREHKNIKCLKPCAKIVCDNGHSCTKPCFKDCGSCIRLVQKVLPACMHKVAVPCFIPPNEFSCTEPCVRMMSCGHKCRSLCGQPCNSQQCEEKVTRTLLCGHSLTVLCSENFSAARYLPHCISPCSTILQCGHKCTGSCGKCHQGRLHQRCKEKCGRTLICGHKCRSPCSNICPPCKERCENHCIHSKCGKPCGEPCDKCSERCYLSCKHMQCDAPCGESCDIAPCRQPCENLLECKHSCMGLCGQPCPPLCDVCHHQEIRKIFFGLEGEPDARFILLEDCGHVFEVQGLTHWMMRESKGLIQMKSCPKCKHPIRNNLHFGNKIKSCLSDIEKVKCIIYGDKAENKIKGQQLIKELNKLKFYSHFNDLLQPVQKIIEGRKNLSSIALIKFENIISICNVFLPLKENLKSVKAHSLSSSSQLVNASLKTEALISDFIKNDYRTASEQQFHDISQELSRLQLLYKFFQFIIKFNTQNETKINDSHVADTINALCKLGPFLSADEDLFNTSFQRMQTIYGFISSDVPSELQKLTLRSMNLSEGNWYYCPKGHVYCSNGRNHMAPHTTCPKCEAAAPKTVVFRREIEILDYSSASSSD